MRVVWQVSWAEQGPRVSCPRHLYGFVWEREGLCRHQCCFSLFLEGGGVCVERLLAAG